MGQKTNPYALRLGKTTSWKDQNNSLFTKYNNFKHKYLGEFLTAFLKKHNILLFDFYLNQKNKKQFLEIYVYPELVDYYRPFRILKKEFYKTTKKILTRRSSKYKKRPHWTKSRNKILLKFSRKRSALKKRRLKYKYVTMYLKIALIKKCIKKKKWKINVYYGLKNLKFKKFLIARLRSRLIKKKVQKFLAFAKWSKLNRYKDIVGNLSEENFNKQRLKKYILSNKKLKILFFYKKSLNIRYLNFYRILLEQELNISLNENYLVKFKNIYVEAKKERRLQKNIYNTYSSFKRNWKLYRTIKYQLSKYKYNQKSNLKYLIEIFYLGIFYKNNQIIVNLIAKILSKKRKQWPFIHFCKNLFGYIEQKPNMELLGVKFEVKGKINGKIRTIVLKYKKGALELSKLSSNIHYAYAASTTKYGVISIKNWIKYKK